MASDGYIDRVFGSGGLLAQKFEGQSYESRPGQVEMARRIHEAFDTGQHLIGEGPCGTGKSLAYSVPAVWHALKGRPHEDESTTSRVIIATGNIALQEQLVNKDLPFLQEVLPKPFRFVLLKGRNNYVCKDRVRENQARGKLPGTSLFNETFDRPLLDLVDWIDGTKAKPGTKTGDKSELSFVPEPKHWGAVSVGSSDCKGKDCQFYDDCFATLAKQDADRADVIVTNFHMLFAHVSVKMASEGHAFILPEFKFLIIDEAHDLPDVARAFFGFDRGPNGIKEMANAAKEWGAASAAIELEESSDSFFDRLNAFAESGRYIGRLTAGVLAEETDFVRFNAAIRDFAIAAENQLEATEESCTDCDGTGKEKSPMGGTFCARCNGAGRIRIELDKHDRKRIKTLFARAQNISQEISEACECTHAPGKVYFIEAANGRPAKVCARSIDVAEMISEELMSETFSTVLVSATLSENASFSFAKRETGLHLHTPIEVIAPTPFDFHNQALLVVPPREQELFEDHCADAFENIVGYFKGRTLGLFTSYKNLKAVAERLRPLVPDLLVQGDKPRSELRQEFKDRTESVLLGTSSFWTGIDVPGESLSAVVIDKLPFPNRGDPVVAAIDELDQNSFHNYMVPRAAIQLRQGAGRLIRSKSDVGVIVILDSRISTKRYGKRFLRSLPAMRITTDLKHIPFFMAEADQWLKSQ